MDIYIKVFLTCEDVERGSDGRTSIYGIHDKLVVDEFPFVIQETKLVCMVEADTEEDSIITIGLEDPNGEPYGDTTELVVKGRENPYNAYFVIALSIPVDKEGYYTFFAKIDDVVQAYHDFYIELRGGAGDE